MSSPTRRSLSVEDAIKVTGIAELSAVTAWYHDETVSKLFARQLHAPDVAGMLATYRSRAASEVTNLEQFGQGPVQAYLGEFAPSHARHFVRRCVCPRWLFAPGRWSQLQEHESGT
jgi:hypothetical protein